MKKSLFALFMAASLAMSMGCSNWNRATPASLDNTAMEAEVRKNLTADGITGITIEVHEGVITLSGHASAADRQKADSDARKVPGVKAVVNNITVP